MTSDSGVFITRGIPNGYEFGIDLQSYAVGEQFIGIKSIPPGPHFLFWSPRNPNQEESFNRSGFIHFFKKGDILVREWNVKEEELQIRFTSETEKNQLRKYYDEAERYLTPFETDQLTKWNSLTSGITENLLNKLVSQTLIIRPCGELEATPDFDRSKYEQKIVDQSKRRRMKLDFLLEDDVDLPYLQPVAGSIPNFTNIPVRCPQESNSADITKHYMDCVAAVDQLFQRFACAEDVLGEIQFSFVIFLAGFSIEGLAQWRNCLLILSNSEQAVEKYMEFYRDYLYVLKYQVPELPEELMQTTENNTVYRDVKQLIINCSQCDGLKESVTDFQETLKQNMLWFLSEDIFESDPEDQPVVVEF